MVLNTAALPVAKVQREPAKKTMQSGNSSPGQEAVDITAPPYMIEFCLKTKTRAETELSGRMLTHVYTCRDPGMLPSAHIQTQELSLNVSAKPQSNDTGQLKESGPGKMAVMQEM